MGRQWYFEDFFPCKFNQAIILLNAQRNSLLAESVKKGIKSFEYKIPSLTYSHTAYTYSKIQQTKMLLTCQRFGDWFLFGLVWPYSSNQKNIMKVGSKSLLLTCSSNKL